jgi:phage/plasmid-associated DNA primase
VVSGQLCYEPFKPFIHHKRLKSNELKKGDGKIYKYFKTVQNWDDEKISNFARDVVAVINKRSGKKNCLWLQGVSNAGKSQVIGSLLNAYFPNTMGTPNNSPRTTFTFNDCMYKRVILWEEPNITIDNIEDVKIILGGQDCRIDAKYQSSAVMQATPFFITSNKHLWALTQGNKQELLNRVHWYRMDQVSPQSNPFPFRKWDWDIFFTENFDSVKYDINKYGH